MKNGGTLREAVSVRLEGLETLNSPEGTVPRWRTSTDKSLTLIGKRKEEKKWSPPLKITIYFPPVVVNGKEPYFIASKRSK